MAAPAVVDASIMVALFADEAASEPARKAMVRFRDAGNPLHAPDLLLVECANAFWKRERRGEMDRDQAMEALGAVSGYGGLRLHPMGGALIGPALSIGMAHGLTAYDAAYAALAIQLGAGVITADGPFAERASKEGLPVSALR